MKNRICEILGIEKPVVQGPLNWLTNARYVAAVSNAGGLGVLGFNAGLKESVSTVGETVEAMRREIHAVKALKRHFKSLHRIDGLQCGADAPADDFLCVSIKNEG